MKYHKYSYLDIDEEVLLKGLTQIQKLCNTISNKSYLNCNDCPLEYCCGNGLLSFINMYSEENDRVVNHLYKINEKIRNDKMTF